MRRISTSSRAAENLRVSPLVGTRPPAATATRRRSTLIRLATSALIVGLIAAFVAGVATNHLPLPAPGPSRGGSIVNALLQNNTILIPELSSYHYDTVTDAAIWAPLWYGDPSGALHPALASKVPSLVNGGISSDLKSWTIHLKPSLKWSDGSALTVADVVFSLNTFADPRFDIGAFPQNDPGDPIDFLGAHMVDSTTLSFSLAHPYVLMNAILADGYHAPIPREVFGRIAPGDIAKSHEAFFPTVTSGPFKVSEHIQGDHLTVVRNPYYYQGPDKPYLDQITFKPALNGEAGLKAAQAGRLDAAFGASFGGDPQLVTDYRALPGYTTYFDSHPAGYEEA
ncbi:MAG TPA: ABC transporter substrate-binding protein, partial [Ktedonobacterales bacterium]